MGKGVRHSSGGEAECRVRRDGPAHSRGPVHSLLGAPAGDCADEDGAGWGHVTPWNIWCSLPVALADRLQVPAWPLGLDAGLCCIAGWEWSCSSSLSLSS